MANLLQDLTLSNSEAHSADPDGTVLGQVLGNVVDPPYPERLLAHWRPETLPDQATGTRVAAWPDAINGIVMSQPVVNNQPVLRKNALNGLSYIQCAQQYLSAVDPGILAASCAPGSAFSVFVIVYNPAATDNNGSALGAQDNAGNGLRIYADDGLTANARYGCTGLYTQDALGGGSHILGFTYDPDYHSLNGTATLLRAMIDGTIIGSVNSHPGGLAAPLSIGITSPTIPSGSFSGGVVEVLWYSGKMSPADLVDLNHYKCRRLGLPLPLRGKFWAATGDSITDGVGIQPNQRYSYPARVASQLALPYGTWTNLGIGGIAASEINGRIPYDLGLLKAKMPNDQVVITAFEFVNSRLSDPASTPFQAAQAMLQGFRALAGNPKIAFGTTIDMNPALISQADKDTYTAAWDVAANRAGLMDVYLPLHTEAHVGVDGAYNAGYGTIFSDGYGHLLQPGYQYLADYIRPLITALLTP